MNTRERSVEEFLRICAAGRGLHVWIAASTAPGARIGDKCVVCTACGKRAIDDIWERVNRSLAKKGIELAVLVPAGAPVTAVPKKKRVTIKSRILDAMRGDMSAKDLALLLPDLDVASIQRNLYMIGELERVAPGVFRRKETA